MQITIQYMLNGALVTSSQNIIVNITPATTSKLVLKDSSQFKDCVAGTIR